jgi:hypothetical protein
MPKIQWTGLPPALRVHLLDRVRERRISAEDLYALKLWRETNPEAPDGPWFKDFGSFKLCGDGMHPKTFLLRGQAARGRRI